MKAYLLTTGIIFAFMAVLHIFVTYEHYGHGNSDPWFVLAPAFVLMISAALAGWAFSLIWRQRPPS